MLRCDGCGAEGWLKTVICRDDRDRGGTLCDACYGPLARLLWIVPGPVTVTAQCSGCGLYLNPSEMAELRGLARERHVGVCVGCAGGSDPALPEALGGLVRYSPNCVEYPFHEIE